MKTYHGSRLLARALCLCLCAAGAQAGVAEVAGMRLEYSDAWLRASAGEEADDDSLILRRANATGSLSVYMPRRAVPLKLDAARFHQQLERKWRLQYGDAARIATYLAAGREWRLCIRPSLETRAKVFHLVTLHAGRAHHILAIDSREATELPSEVAELLERAVWRDDSVTTAAQVAPAALIPATASAPPVASTPGVAASPEAAPPSPTLATPASDTVPEPANPAAVPAAPVVVAASPVPSSGASPPAPPPEATTHAGAGTEAAPARPGRLLGPWRLLRAGRVVATGSSLATLAEAEANRLGDSGMLLGYGLRLGDESLHAFLDGYEFDPYVPGKAGRKPFAHAWRGSWRMPEIWYPGIGLALPITISDGSTAATPGNSTWHIEATALCGPRLAMVRAFDALDRGDPQAEAQLAGLACVGAARPLASAAAGLAAPDSNTPETITLGLARLAGVPETAAKGNVRRILLSLGIEAEATPGAALLRGARFLYIYGPDEQFP